MTLTSIELNAPNELVFNDTWLYDFCRANKSLRIERSTTGQLLIAMPTTGKTSNTNFKLIARLAAWVEQTGLGVGFDSSGGFSLPNRAMRAADAAWISSERWGALTAAEQDQFPPLCPDFVIELLSKTDSLSEAKKKMTEWMTNGCRLAWLIDLNAETVYIYRQNQPLETRTGKSAVLSGDTVLPNFTLDLSDLL
jgi:Uma2 family endonuclease